MADLSRSYYLEPVKIIRDLVHGYINLTRFDLDLIDTVEFQRLSDIRQLTCQHIYPAARHTRFEHSLGVLELMRNAIRHLNQNGILGRPAPDSNSPIFDDNLQFNAAVAALLHDVGHCPFSHMGETRFDAAAVRARLIRELEGFEKTSNCKDLIQILKGNAKAGSVHEQISCIVILQNFRGLLSDLTHKAEGQEKTCELHADFELIIRSILGLEYRIHATGMQDAQIKNVIIRLLNSQIFDVDKLDYIMRDSYLTGIGTPAIDRQRLFRNMFLDEKYFVVFTSKAVPALQNLIDARDGLYLYVYNHHAVVYSDFLNVYISRRLFHNARSFLMHAYPDLGENDAEQGLEEIAVSPQMYRLGLVPTTYLFSVDAVVRERCSDSTWISLLRTIHANYSRFISEGLSAEEREAAEKNLRTDIGEQLSAALNALPPEITVPPAGGKGRTDRRKYVRTDTLSEEAIELLSEKIQATMFLIHQAMRRRYLKPWWKTVFEFSNFMTHNFRDDRLRQQVGTFICNGIKDSLQADEMRSQIAKHVVDLTKRLKAWERTMEEMARNPAAGKMPETRPENASGLVEELHGGEFFVVQRSTNFFSTDTIEKLEIALKDSEVAGASADASRQVNQYYLKKLTNIIPQKKYSSIYAKEGFYVFSKRPSPKALSTENPTISERKHYEMLEKIFVFVTASLVSEGEQSFVENYQGNGHEEAEKKSQDMLYRAFLTHMRWPDPGSGESPPSE